MLHKTNLKPLAEDEKKSLQTKTESLSRRLNLFTERQKKLLGRTAIWLEISGLDKRSENLIIILKNLRYLEKIESGIYILFRLTGGQLDQGMFDVMMKYPKYADDVGSALAAAKRCDMEEDKELNKLVEIKMKELEKKPENSLHISAVLEQARIDLKRRNMSHT